VEKLPCEAHTWVAHAGRINRLLFSERPPWFDPLGLGGGISLILVSSSLDRKSFHRQSPMRKSHHDLSQDHQAHCPSEMALVWDWPVLSGIAGD